MPVYTVRGRLSQGRIVELETPLPLEGAEVEVVITVAPQASPHNWRESLQQIWDSLEVVGHTAPHSAASFLSVAHNLHSGARKRVKVGIVC